MAITGQGLKGTKDVDESDGRVEIEEKTSEQTDQEGPRRAVPQCYICLTSLWALAR